MPLPRPLPTVPFALARAHEVRRSHADEQHAHDAEDERSRTARVRQREVAAALLPVAHVDERQRPARHRGGHLGVGRGLHDLQRHLLGRLQDAVAVRSLRLAHPQLHVLHDAQVGARSRHGVFDGRVSLPARREVAEAQAREHGLAVGEVRRGLQIGRARRVLEVRARGRVLIGCGQLERGRVRDDGVALRIGLEELESDERDGRRLARLGVDGRGAGIPVKNFDAALYALPEEKLEKMVPDLLITYGGHIVSKRLKQFLRKHPPREHWHVSLSGEVTDLYGSLTTVIEMDPFEFLEKIAYLLENRTTEFPRIWENNTRDLPQPEFSYSEMAAIGTLIKSLPTPAALHLGNSSAVRYAQLYTLPEDVEVCCNRGTSGIEGSLSTAIGYSVCSDKLNFVVIGDLSFFYDMNALWNSNFGCNLRILLLNNGGGEIFQALPAWSFPTGLK